MPPKPATRAAKAPAKPRQGSKATTTVPAAAIVVSTEPVLPVTPPRRPLERENQGQAASETPGEWFHPVSPTSSDVDSAIPGNPVPPVLVSPIKRRQRRTAPTINSLRDLDVWDMSDGEILDAAKMTWRSDVYDHYDIEIRRNYTTDGLPLSMTYVFNCATHPMHHTAVRTRLRENTGDGTTNLRKDVDICLRKQGRARTVKPSPTTIPYSEAAHRALIALRCAKSARPVNLVLDEDYQREVDMLRPGTKLPHPMTVQRDLVYIYEQSAEIVKQYFLQLNSTIHLVLDGWTSPLISSYLGLVVVWFDQGVIYRVILEFIRLTKKHDGQYLATVTAACLKRFGLEQHLLGLCMDNASNCNKLAELLPQHIPTFQGTNGRLRCLAHIINLVAKIFISFFFKKPKAKKSVTIFAEDNNDDNIVVVDSGDDSDSNMEDPAAEEAAIESEQTQDEDGQVAHDDAVVKSLADIAIRDMKNKDVVMSDYEKKIALKIFPAIAGLARRVHDSSSLNEKFQMLIEQDTELSSTKRALDRRVPTRWNSDFDCLAAHLHFRDVVEALTGASGNKLQAYRLSEEQWDLANDVEEVLKLFKDVTLLFSQAEVPLIVDALPMLYHLQQSLKAVVDDIPQNDGSDEESDNESDNLASNTPAVIRIAAYAGVLLIDKYMDLTWDCEIYVIAIVMCPDRKLQWLKDYVSSEKLKEIKKMVTNRWTKSYAPAQSQIPVAKVDTKGKSKWAAPSASSKSSKYPADSIQTYLSEGLAASDTIIAAGGYMKYWHQMSSTRPNLARMAQSFCSAPATSVDAERAFSTGRRQVNHMQHNMSSQTFKARMALGSWARTPIFPAFPDVKKMVESRMGIQDPDNEERGELDI